MRCGCGGVEIRGESRSIVSEGLWDQPNDSFSCRRTGRQVCQNALPLEGSQ